MPSKHHFKRKQRTRYLCSKTIIQSAVHLAHTVRIIINLGSFFLPSTQVNDISFHPQFGTFATVGSDGKFSFWDKDARTKLKVILFATDILSQVHWQCSVKQLCCNGTLTHTAQHISVHITVVKVAIFCCVCYV